MTFLASLRSEFLKTKRTSVIYLVLIAALVVPFVMVLDHGSPDPAKPANGWDNYYREGFMVFAFIFLPFFFLLTSTLLMQIEVRNNAWKQVLASPQAFIHLLMAKFTVLQAFAVAFMIIFNIYMLIGCALIDVLYDSNFLAYLHRWREIIKLNFLAWGATVGISGISFWLALRSKNFIAPIAIGFLLWLLGPAAAFELKWPHSEKYVYVLPFTIMAKKFEGQQLFYQFLSLGYGLVFLGVAYLEFVLKRLQWKSFWFAKTHNQQLTAEASRSNERAKAI